MLDKTKKDWWKDAVLYQIYPKSFQDTNDDGIGDLPGITQNLDYLERLGIDGIWLSPICSSPQEDNGYDISDYRSIDPMFGTMTDFEELVSEARSRGISIIMDLVLNHTSDQHEWFKDARKSRDNPYHDYYIWRDGEEGILPNDLPAVFGGPVWHWVPEVGQYYYAGFSPYQPDLNWENPAVRRELYDMIRFWIGKGVEGFRLDAIAHISKDVDNGVWMNGKDLHPYLKELRREAFPEDGIMTVGEAGLEGLDSVRSYTDGSELDMVFEFSIHHYGGYDRWKNEKPPVSALRDYFTFWQQNLHENGWNALFLENHDLPRIVSRWGSEAPHQKESAKMLAALFLGLEGTPFIYQGSELGMTNLRLPLDEYVDLAVKSEYAKGLELGYSEEEAIEIVQAQNRDNARTPMQWNTEPNAGFTKGVPWLPVNPNFQEINAEAEMADPDSVFNFYRQLIALRKELPVFRTGEFTPLQRDSATVLAYRRDSADGHLLIACNMTEDSQPFDVPADFADADLIAANYPDAEGALRPFETRIMHFTDQ
ncbi:MAG: alpha-glucosidase [Clostridia bacterium]|nr:alpha-glucosidase [Clostridia bacterium]